MRALITLAVFAYALLAIVVLAVLPGGLKESFREGGHDD
jgi:hypothetical protein